MTLLNTHDTLLPAYIHPDRIAFQFCFASPPDTTAYAARTALKHLVSDGRDLPGMALSFTIPVEGIATPLRVKFTKPSRAKPFYFKIYLSPLALFRDHLTLEISKDGQNNYLSARQLSTDNSFVARGIASLLVPIETALDALADRLAKEVRPSGYSSLLEWRLHAIELCADLRTDDPGYIVERAYGGIRKHFKHTIKSTYPSAAAYQGVEADSLMAWGFAQRGERIKAYEKTTRRVRFECSLDKHALDNVLQDKNLTRKLDSWDAFESVCKILALHAAERFQLLTAEMPEGGNTGASPIQLLTLASRGFSPDFTEQALLSLGRTGRMRRAFSPGTVRAWQARGILRRTSHGYYTVTDEFRCALHSISQLADHWNRPPSNTFRQ